MQFRYCNLISRLARVAEFHAALSPAEFPRGLCGFLVSGSSWTEVQCLTDLCPLWVISGHAMSALPPKADMPLANVR